MNLTRCGGSSRAPKGRTERPQSLNPEASWGDAGRGGGELRLSTEARLGSASELGVFSGRASRERLSGASSFALSAFFRGGVALGCLCSQLSVVAFSGDFDSRLARSAIDFRAGSGMEVETDLDRIGEDHF